MTFYPKKRETLQHSSTPKWKHCITFLFIAHLFVRDDFIHLCISLSISPSLPYATIKKTQLPCQSTSRESYSKRLKSCFRHFISPFVVWKNVRKYVSPTIQHRCHQKHRTVDGKQISLTKTAEKHILSRW